MRVRNRMLKKGTGKWRLFLFGAAIGAAVFLLIYGFMPLNLLRDDWILDGYIEQDILQHYLGWLSYRESPLSFPLCIAQTINYPAGISVAYTDSIPLFAILFRLIEGILPATFQYFGLFVFLCFMLQGGCAAVLIGLFVKGTLKPLLGSLLFVLNPILLERAFRHTALSAQFLILLALYLYFDGKQKNAPPSLWFIGLGALAMLIHPYFVPMVLAALFASVVEYGFKNRRILRPAIMVVVSVGVCLFTAYCIGYFHTGASRTVGYGYFCMNLNALFNPVSKGVENWSLLLPKWKQGLGTYEGFNYLGLGTLLLFAAAVLDHLLHWKKRQTLRRIGTHGGLLFVCLCLTVFAVSNVVVLNSFVLFSVELSWKWIDLLSMLRASGRMFWVVNYLIVLSAVLFVCRRAKAKHAALLLAAAAAVQAVDMAPALIQKHQDFAAPTAEYSSPFVSEFWSVAAEEYDHIFSFEAQGVSDALYLQLLAQSGGMTSNDQFFARQDEEAHSAQIEQVLEAARQGEIDSDTLYIMTREDLFFRYAGYFLEDCLCARVDRNWYVFAPWNDAMRSLDISRQDVFVYEEIPFTIADYTDEDWTAGVWNQDPALVCFYDNESNRQKLEGAEALVMSGTEYSILEIDMSDPGWILVRLDRSGEPLRGAMLETKTSREPAA